MKFEEKYAPTQFSDLIFEEQSVAERLAEYAANLRHRHLLLVGDYGVAKSTTAMMIAKERADGKIPVEAIDCVNAVTVLSGFSDVLNMIEAGWRLHRDWCGIEQPVAVIDELHLLQPVALQYRLRAVMDKKDSGVFIFTANHLHAIDNGILNRCDVVHIKALSITAIAERCEEILRAEGKPLSRKKLMNIISTCDGSWRDTLGALEDTVLAM